METRRTRDEPEQSAVSRTLDEAFWRCCGCPLLCELWVWISLGMLLGTLCSKVPALPESFAAWMGPIQPPAWFQRAYEVDEVLTSALSLETSTTGGRAKMRL
eukprot:383152-Amphidinium_carterae.1